MIIALRNLTMNQLEQHLLSQEDDMDKGKTFFWHRIRSRYVFSSLKKYISATKPKLLDFGSGAGIFYEHMQNENSPIQYYFKEELNSLATSLEKRAGPQSNRSNSDNFIDMDAVILLDVLEHLKNDVEFLKELRKKLNPKCILIITCPALMALWSNWDISLGHYTRYNKKSFINTLESSGFEILDMRYMFNAMVIPGLLRKMGLLNTNSEFPKLSKGVNQLAYFFCLIEQTLLSFLPFGSSIAATVTLKPERK